ncbi:hypothetical protein PCASD_09910 [Puccinia coronata f. sp. avenae]|uniref:Uncharacterized protein n=1 Tax=Puccinia coronata f. sp. avenae TaxID=200324 RepID=A0A2N5UI42_9BASI|nr:hypothetical protein PCASD_09910 [Puccinia coronata f. sp. avenae]
MRMKFNPLIQSAVWYFAWKVAVAHPGFPPTGHTDGLGAFGLHSGQGDLSEVVNRATSLKRKRPAEGDPVDARMSCSVSPYLEYSSGMSFHPTTHYPDHISGSQTVNPENFLLPSDILENRREIRDEDSDYDGTSFLKLLESYFPAPGATLEGPYNQVGPQNSLESYMDPYPTNIAHDSGFQTKRSATGLQAVNPESHDLRPSPEIQIEMGDNNYGGTSFLQLLEPHLASTGKPPDADPSQVGTKYTLKGSQGEQNLEKSYPVSQQ